MRKRIAVIEDERGIAGFVGLLLTSAGYEVQIASGSAEGRALLAAGPPPDLVVLDLLPESREGLRLLREIKVCWPRLPVAVVSPGLDPGAREAARQAGADRLIAKPFDPGEFERAIARLLPGDPSPGDPPRPARAGARDRQRGTTARPVRLLLIEDDANDALLFRRQLEKADVAILFGRVATWAEARVRLAADPLDVVVLDLALPDSEGIGEMIAQVRARQPSARVLVLTGFSHERIAEEAQRAGADGVFLKGEAAGEALLRSALGERTEAAATSGRRGGPEASREPGRRRRASRPARE